MQRYICINQLSVCPTDVQHFASFRKINERLDDVPADGRILNHIGMKHAHARSWDEYEKMKAELPIKMRVNTQNDVCKAANCALRTILFMVRNYFPPQRQVFRVFCQSNTIFDRVFYRNKNHVIPSRRLSWRRHCNLCKYLMGRLRISKFSLNYLCWWTEMFPRAMPRTSPIAWFSLFQRPMTFNWRSFLRLQKHVTCSNLISWCCSSQRWVVGPFYQLDCINLWLQISISELFPNKRPRWAHHVLPKWSLPRFNFFLF